MEKTYFDPQEWQHWALLVILIGMVVWGYWQVSRNEEQGSSHVYDRETGQVRRRSNDD